MRRAEVQARLGALEARVRTELALGLDDVRGEQPDAAELDDARLVEREDVLVRRIGLLGRVNPLALEEFQALEERHRFLSDQLNDLRRSRRDLEEVIEAVDDRIRVVFKEAFDDVAREFAQTFETVFPGGKGRLVLTGEEDLLTAGVEVEARPPGKKVQRLSLLSGGERSLTVLAFVFAIFRARPSPFYVLDEVDAALDDVNLQRLLKVIRSFRGHAQIIMVTHQKRSMEIADLLYGITMGPDAVTKVVSERLRDRRAVVALDERVSDATDRGARRGATRTSRPPCCRSGRPERGGAVRGRLARRHRRGARLLGLLGCPRSRRGARRGSPGPTCRRRPGPTRRAVRAPADERHRPSRRARAWRRRPAALAAPGRSSPPRSPSSSVPDSTMRPGSASRRC
jgi:hypothetical protein